MHALGVSERGSTACVVVVFHGVCHGFEVTHEMTHMRANDSRRAARSVVQASVVCVILPRRSVSAEVPRAMYKSSDCTRPGIPDVCAGPCVLGNSCPILGNCAWRGVGAGGSRQVRYGVLDCMWLRRVVVSLYIGCCSSETIS